MSRSGIAAVVAAGFVSLAGAAPAPTNEYQRAIWNDVHKIPEKPMKIDFDPAKGK